MKLQFMKLHLELLNSVASPCKEYKQAICSGGGPCRQEAKSRGKNACCKCIPAVILINFLSSLLFSCYLPHLFDSLSFFSLHFCNCSRHLRIRGGVWSLVGDKTSLYQSHIRSRPLILIWVGVWVNWDNRLTMSQWGESGGDTHQDKSQEKKGTLLSSNAFSHYHIIYYQIWNITGYFPRDLSYFLCASLTTLN